MGTCAVYKAYSNSLLVRTLFSRGNIFTNIGENQVLAKISEFTVCLFCGLTLKFFQSVWNHNATLM